MKKAKPRKISFNKRTCEITRWNDYQEFEYLIWIDQWHFTLKQAKKLQTWLNESINYIESVEEK